MKKSFAFILAMAMSLSLAACGGNNAPASSAPQSTAPEASSAAPTTPEKKPVTINVVTTYAGTDGNAPNYQNAVKEWEAKTGNKVSDASAISDEAFKARVISEFGTGAEPDVLFFFNGVDSNPFVERQLVVSIDEIRAKYPDYATNMKDGMLGASPADGKNYSVPVNGYWEAMYVNKNVLNACGLQVPGADYTYDQFLKDCETIKQKGFIPIAASLVEVPHYWFEFGIYNNLSVAEHNVLPVKDANNTQYKGWVSGLTDIKELYEKGYFPKNTLSAKDEETFNMFMEDKAAFLIDGSWKTGGIQNTFVAKEGEMPDESKLQNFTVTYVPGKGNRKSTDLIGGLSSGYFISRKAWENDEVREAAVDFVKFMTSDEMVSKFAGISATALKAGVKVDESQLSSLQKEGIKIIAGATGMASAVQDQVPPDCRAPIFDDMSSIVTGKKTAQAAVDACLDLLAAQAK